MKKRLSLLMAALMIVTMLPMSSAFAASKPYVTVQTIEDTDKKGEATVVFEIEKFQPLNEGKVAFELENARLQGGLKADNKVVDGEFYAPVIKVKDRDGAETTVKAITAAASTNGVVGGDVIKTDDTFVVEFADVAAPENNSDAKNIQVSVQLKLDYKQSVEGDVVLKVKDLGAAKLTNKDVNVGTQDVKIAVVKSTTKNLSIKVKKDEEEISYDGGVVSRFDILNFDDADATHMAIELDKDDYYALDLAKTKIVIDGETKFADNVAFQNDGDGYLVLIPRTGGFAGKKFITVIPEIRMMGRSASEGNINVNVRLIKQVKDKDGALIAITPASYVAGNYATVQSDSATIGKVVDYKVTMKVVEKGKKEIPSIWGGEEATVEVTLTAPKGSFSNRGVEFSVKDADVKTGIKVTSIVPNEGQEAKVSDGFVRDAIYKDGEFVISGTSNKTTKLVFTMTIISDHGFNGTATITAAQRGWETTADLAKVTPKFTIDTKSTDMKKGEIKDTENIVITEAKEGLLRNNEKITLLFSTTRDYVEFTKAAKVEATNGMTFGTVRVRKVGDVIKANNASKSLAESNPRFSNNGAIVGREEKAQIAMEIPIKKQSKGGAAVITISGIQARVDGSTVDQTIPVRVGLNLYQVAKADYIKVVKEYGLEPVLTVFTIGQTQYTVNGMPKTAASAPYVKNGRTMLPVRALAESLGLHVQWNGATKTATFTDSTKVAAVVIGSDTMHINGTPVKLSAKAEIVNGTTFIELRSLATVFGVQIDWDAAAKTATVSK